VDSGEVAPGLLRSFQPGQMGIHHLFVTLDGEDERRVD
jgi:hypothetical protein